MTYKMIVLDLDDTLLRDDHTISPKTKEVLIRAQEQGIKVVLASGRPTLAMRPYAEELKLDHYGSYILSFNGANVLNYRTDELVLNSTLTREQVNFLFEQSKIENTYIHTYIDDVIITEDINPYTQIESDITGLPIEKVDTFMDHVTKEPVKVLMVDEPKKLEAIQSKLIKEPSITDVFSVFRSKPYFLEFTEKGITKGTRLNQLAQSLGIKQEEIIAMGDSYNDLEMIEYAGLGVAMENAPDEIKNRSNLTTASNNNEGVSQVIEDYVLTVHQ
ncbi:hypothetical protein SAMN05421734_11221 [Pelagirhabdus alkalitolerans]|uniref:Cof subfamily of IIB subfamily of haloacid dehalogenase superfamily/HAD-superfamily hydrolase, subfamily IIB n=1 Tax=Pelagirhabdus alkalitolerans TaxID=1612202 RepID=A0A1G6MQU5_9BACI|nr:Cof-type HAD-IIB family hydrolase [Pelagirhabdus alkalitolerans]SDC57909.1 hypothetical protein SAMN05421734_11221 [Pelagirhabdus alkalitolerans]